MSWLSTLLKRRKRKAELKTVSQQARTPVITISDPSSRDTSIFSDPLNPLNPLSPISPISIWNTSESDSTPSHTYQENSVFESAPNNQNDYSSHSHDSGESSYDSGSSSDSSWSSSDSSSYDSGSSFDSSDSSSSSW